MIRRWLVGLVRQAVREEMDARTPRLVFTPDGKTFMGDRVYDKFNPDLTRRQ